MAVTSGFRRIIELRSDRHDVWAFSYGCAHGAACNSTDPDTTHTLAVDLTQSTGILNSGTQSDCDNFRTLCYVDGELISFEDATLTGSFKYDLGAHGAAQNITGATNASPIQITVANHGLGSGETVVVASVGGNTGGQWDMGDHRHRRKYFHLKRQYWQRSIHIGRNSRRWQRACGAGCSVLPLERTT